MVHIETAPCLLVAKWSVQTQVLDTSWSGSSKTLLWLSYSHKSEQYTGMKPQPHTTAQMNFTNNLSKRSQTQKHAHCMIPFTQSENMGKVIYGVESG